MITTTIWERFGLTRDSIALAWAKWGGICVLLASAGVDLHGSYDVPTWAVNLIRLTALIVSVSAAQHRTSELPGAPKGAVSDATLTNIAKTTPLLLLVCLLGSAAITPACAPPPHVQTQAGANAYTADQVVQRLAELQNAVIAASDANKIRLADARTIVMWISGDAHANPPRLGLVQAIQASPAGWKAVALAEWPAIRPLLANNTTLAPWAEIVDAMVGGQ